MNKNHVVKLIEQTEVQGWDVSEIKIFFEDLLPQRHSKQARELIVKTLKSLNRGVTK